MSLGGRAGSDTPLDSAVPCSFNTTPSSIEAEHTTHGLASLLRRASITPSQSRRLTKPRPEEKMSSPKVSISTAEFEALPTSIQRKYFSSEERLAIAQRSAVEKRQRQSSKKSTCITDSIKSPVLGALPKRRKTFQRCDSKQQSRRSSLPSAWEAKDDVVVDSDTNWFDSLPEKVKRSQFSKQEIEAIAAQKELEPERPRTSSACKPRLDSFSSWEARVKLRQKTSFHSPSVSVSPSTCSNQTSHSAPQISRSHSPLSSSLSAHRSDSRSTPPSPAIPALTLTTPREHTSGLRRPSARRPLGLQPLPLPPPVLAPISYTTSLNTSGYVDIIKTLGSIPGTTIGDVMGMDEETTPTQETEDIRLDISSEPPAWYDGKLNFDFESDYHKPSLSNSAFSDQPRTLSPSISDAASCDTSGPMTPISPAIHLQHAFDQSINRLPPLPQQMQQQQQQQPRSGDTPDSIGHNSNITNFSHPQHAMLRESSPRRKPTRQHPRHLVDGFYENHQNQPYSITIHYNKDDPLALETLPVCDDLTGAHGAFAVPDHDHSATGFRKVLKVIRGH